MAVVVATDLDEAAGIRAVDVSSNTTLTRLVTVVLIVVANTSFVICSKLGVFASLRIRKSGEEISLLKRSVKKVDELAIDNSSGYGSRQYTVSRRDIFFFNLSVEDFQSVEEFQRVLDLCRNILLHSEKIEQ